MRRLLEADNLTDIAQGLVTQNGNKPVRLVQGVWDAWGIDMKTCRTYCDRQSFPMVGMRVHPRTWLSVVKPHSS